MKTPINVSDLLRGLLVFARRRPMANRCGRITQNGQRRMASLALVVLAWISSTHPATSATSGMVVAWGSQTNVSALALTGVTAISTRWNSLALKEDGAVLTWGSESFALTNIPVAARSGVTAIAAGSMHSLALKSDKTVVAWGLNIYGLATVPGAVQSNATAVAAGNAHSVVLKEDGTVVVWGYDDIAQASVAAGLTGVVAIASGSIHTLALKSDGTVVAWGLNRGGQLDVPPGLTNVTAIAGGLYHSVALRSDGTVVAWGTNDSGQTSVPEGLTGVVAIAAGDRHTLALKNDGTLVGWGDNTYGQITMPAGLPRVIAIAAAGYYNLAIVERPAIVTNGCLIATSPPDRIKYVSCDGWIFDDHGISVSNRCPDTATTPFEVQCQPPVGTWLDAGNHAIHCRVVAEGTVIADWGFPITVVKTNGPLMILCATNQITLFPPCYVGCVTVDYALPEVRGGALVQCTPPPGTCFSAPRGIGGSVVTPVTCRATNCGLYAECTFRIVVVQDPNQFRTPVFEHPPQDRVVTNQCGSGCVPVFYPLPTPSYGTLDWCDPPPGTCLPVGTNRVVCRASNYCRQTASTAFDVVIVRGTGQLPSFSASDIVVTNCSTNCMVVDYSPPVVSPGASVVCTPPSGTCFPVGLTTVNCVATNECGSVACEFPVAVELDSRPLSITCPTNHIRTILCASNCEPVEYELPTITNGKLEQCTPPPGTCFPVGVTWITCLATNDCGARTGCPFNVRVLTEPPVILCPANEFGVYPPCYTNCAPANYPLPEVRNGTLIACTPPPGACMGGPLGSSVYTVTCRATNDCGTLAQCTFPIRVSRDPFLGNLYPDFNFVRDDVVTNHCGMGCVPVNYHVPQVIYGELEGCTPPRGTCLPVGTHRIVCRATNVCQLSASAGFYVRVVPGSGRLPAFGLRDVVVTNCFTNCLIVDYPLPVVPPGASIRCNPPPGSCFPVGRSLVTCVASNECGIFGNSFNVWNLPFGPCIEPPRNMVLWLPFDETNGPIAHNLIPGALDGTHVNGPRNTDGQDKFYYYPPGQSLTFDGSNDFVRVPHYSAIGLGQSDMTISAWVYGYRGSTNGRRAIVSKIETNSAAGRRGYELYLREETPKLDLFGDTVRTFDSGAVIPGSWSHVAITVSRSGNGEVRFYLNGENVAVQPGPIPASIGNSTPLFVGASTVGSGGPVIAPFLGNLDEVNIFNRALTAGEIASLARRTLVMCKIKASVPRAVPFPPGSECVNIPVRVCNNLAISQTITWTAGGAVPITTPGGSFVLPPFECTDLPVTVCRPTNGLPVGAAAQWTFTVSSDFTCPVTSTGLVVNPGPLVRADVVTTIAQIPGTNTTHTLGVRLSGLPPGQLTRLRVIGPDMEPDLDFISLDGLPPGEPVIRRMPDDDRDEFGLDVRFTSVEPVGLYTVLVETDLDGDGDFDPLASFAAESPVASPPTLSVVEGINGYHLLWNNEGDGFGFLQWSDEPDGPWETIPDAGPGYLVSPSQLKQYFRVIVPE